MHDFTLKAKDILAPLAILEWIRAAHQLNVDAGMDYPEPIPNAKLASACRHLAEIFESQGSEVQFPD